MRRRLWLGMAMATTLLAGGLSAGCSSEPIGGKQEVGTLRLPLSTHGPSGTQYRLRDAVFQIDSRDYYYYEDDHQSGGAGGTNGPNITVSSEDDPNAESISVSIERGYYYVRLQPGWRMEKVVDGAAETVEAQLLSNASQWVYVNAHSTTWVEFSFGIGGRELWFNGDLNIGVAVYEDPSDINGDGGTGGDSNVGAGGFGG